MSVLGKIKKGYKATATAVTSLPEAGSTFGRSLAEGVREDVARKGSAGQRFADAPLGQYYLPRPVKSALSILAPSPRKVVRDVTSVSRNPSVGNVAAAANDVFSIATLPAVGTGAIKGAAAIGRASKIAAGARGLPIGERIGLAARAAVTREPLFHGTTQEAAEAIRKSGFTKTIIHPQGLHGGEAAKAYVTESPRIAARYARSASLLSETKSKPAVVIVQAKKGAQAIEQTSRGRLGTELAFHPEDVAAKVLQFPNRPADVARRVKGRVFSAIGEEISRASAEGKRGQEISQRIAEIKAELARSSPSNITELARKAKTLPRGLKPGERGFMRMPEGDKAKNVVARANARLRGIKFQQEAGKLQERTAGELKSTAHALRNTPVTFSQRGKRLSYDFGELKTHELKTHPRRLPRN